MKKYLSLILAVLMVLTAVSAIAEETSYDKTLNMTMNIIKTDLIQADPRTAMVLEKFNLNIEFITCSSSDYAEKSHLWIAGDDMPDVMWTAFGVTAPEHTEYVESGLLQPWPDLENYPNLKAIQDSIGKAVDVSIAKNGDRYYLFTEGGYMNTRQFRSIMLYYRTDWAKKVGLYHEDNTYTWDEVMEMAIAFGTQDPDGNGINDTIGMTSVSGMYPSLYGFTQNALNYSAFVPVDNAYHWRAGDEDVLEAIKDLKYMYDNGALWEEQIMASTDDGANKFMTGLAGICGNNWHMGQLGLLVSGLQTAYPGVDVLDIVSPMKVVNKDGSVMTAMLSDGYWGEISVSASIDPEVLDRFMDMFEYLASDEGFLLGAIGMEGVDYTYDENGEMQLLWEKDETGSYVDPYVTNAHRFVSLPRLAEGWALESPTSNEAAKTLGQRANNWIQESYDNDTLNYTATDWNLALLTADTAPLYKGLVLSPTADEKIKELVLSSTADTIIDEYLAWVESVQGQIKPVEEELTKVVFGE